MDLINKFNDLVKDQFVYGGKKYANTEEKEATDCLFDTYSYKWLLGTIDKYTYRYSNLARERDVLKIATYMYILWLKRGFHISEEGSEEPINTTVPIKEANFEKFFNKVKTDKDIETIVLTPMEKIHISMETWAMDDDFQLIEEDEIIYVYILALNEWIDKFSKTAGSDTDTNNEAKIARCGCSKQ